MNWIFSDTAQKLVDCLQGELELHPLIARILVNRNIKDVKEARIFLDTHIGHLSPPHLLKGVKEALERINKAKERKEKVFIFGDYDVDGICSCALMDLTLQKMGLNTVYYLPHRVDEGYGINMNAVEKARKDKVKLFISVDSGITSFAEIEKLKKFKIDVIVVDHHQPNPKGLPKADIIINPKAHKQEPYYDLTAVGLVFKLCQALRGSYLEEDLDLVALGTICDVAALIGENRILVKEGLKRIAQTQRPGLRALKEIAGIENREISVSLVGFVLGPRLNAMGRISSAESSLKLLKCSDEEEAKVLAKSLDETNRRRQRIEEKILQEAIAQIEGGGVNFKNHSVIVVGGDGWHPGVVGIVAAKLADKYWRPTFVLGLEDEVYRGSGRSVNNFHLFDALCECDTLLQTYGGHRNAAGLTVVKDNLEKFKEHINQVARSRLSPKDLIPVLSIDAEVPLSTWQDQELVADIERLAPFGMGNQRPIFCSRNLVLKSAPTRVGKNTLRMWLSDADTTLKAVGFGMADFSSLLQEGSCVDAAYAISLDTWQEPVAQLEIKDLKFRK